jgi:hypothetical protein
MAAICSVPVLCATAVLAGLLADRLGGFDSPGIANDAISTEHHGPTHAAISMTAVARTVSATQATEMGGVFVVDIASAFLAPPAFAFVPATLVLAEAAATDAEPAEHAGVAVAVTDAAAADHEPAQPILAPAPMSVHQAATAEPFPSAPTAEPATATAVAGEPATPNPESPQTTHLLAGAFAAEVSDAPGSDSRPMPAAEKRAQLASLFTSDPATEYPKTAVRPVETLNECLVAEICIDDYLWSLYERTPKIDTNKVTERIKAKVKKKGKTRIVTKTVTKYVLGDFTWKDPIAAQRAGMPIKDYVIGGMDRRFKIKLYHALRAMDDAGLMPGITSAFRDDYRQSIASGRKAASDGSYHGGSRRGGYGHGLAADLVSVKGETRMQRYVSSKELWKWIDAREKELGIGRPYLDRDPPHVGPTDGKEYVVKRARANAQRAGLHRKKGSRLAVRTAP